jgi:hypothetical protein
MQWSVSGSKSESESNRDESDSLNHDSLSPVVRVPEEPQSIAGRVCVSSKQRVVL